MIDVWLQSGFRVPSRLTAVVDGDIFLVIEDHLQTIRLMNIYGQIFITPRSACVAGPNWPEWECQRADMILCEAQTPIDLFVLDELVPLMDTMY